MENAAADSSEDFGADSTDVSAALSSAAPFRALPTRILADVVKISEARRYGPGATVFTAGQYDGSEFYLVVVGSLQISIAAAESGAMIVDQAHPGAVFGLAAAVAGVGQEHCERITLMTPGGATLIALDSQSFRRLAARRPSLSRTLARYFAEQLTLAQFGAVAQGAAEQRIYAALLGYVERDNVTGEWRIARMPKHRELAERAGTDEATAAASVARLIQDGAARRDYPGLIIADLSHLRRLAS